MNQSELLASINKFPAIAGWTYRDNVMRQDYYYNPTSYIDSIMIYNYKTINMLLKVLDTSRAIIHKNLPHNQKK